MQRTHILKNLAALLKRRLSPSFEKSITPLVRQQADRVMAAHRQKSGKALFIDMGSNLGQGFRFFSRFYGPDLFDYWLIEANPLCIEQLRSTIKGLYRQHRWQGEWDIINKAVSDREGELSLYGLVEDHRGKTSSGASIVPEHNSALYTSDEEAARRYATIVVKMDIESAEYDALDDLIATGCIDKIDHLYVEWHSQYYAEDTRQPIQAREHRLKQQIRHKLTDWH
jgi:FkbM family methyltransferase